MLATSASTYSDRILFKMMLSNGKQLLQKANEVAGRARLDRDVEMVLRKERGVTLQQQSMLQHVLNSPIFL